MAEGEGGWQRSRVTNVYVYDDWMEATQTVTNNGETQFRQIWTGGDSSGSAEIFPEGQSSTQPTQALSPALDRMKLTDEYEDNYFAEEQADLLMKDSKFSKAIDLLDHLPQSRGQQMKLLECYFQHGRDRDKMLECIENMKMLVTRSPRPKAVDVYQLGKANFEKSSHIKAMTFFVCAAKIFREDSDSNQGVDGIRCCSFRSLEVIVAMIKQNEGMRDLACDVGMKIMKNICDDVTSVNGADPHVKADMEARCLNNTGICYRKLKRYERAIELYESGIDIIDLQFGENSSKFKIFGILLNNMGAANVDLGNYPEAVGLYKRAIDALKRAQDWTNDEEKKESVERTEINLRNAS